MSTTVSHPSKSFIDMTPLNINNILGNAFKDEVNLNNAIDSVYGKCFNRSSSRLLPTNSPKILLISSQDSGDRKQLPKSSPEIVNISSQDTGDMKHLPDQ